MKLLTTVLIGLITVNCAAIGFKGESIPIQDSATNLAQLNLLKYEYAYFKANTDEEKYTALFQKLNICLNQSYIKKITFELDRMNLLKAELLLQQNYYYIVGTALFKAELYDECSGLLSKNTDTIFRKELSFLQLLCYNKTHDLNAVKTEIKKAYSFLNCDTIALFNSLADYTIESRSKELKIAQLFMPGLGMIKGGELKEGIVSFGLHAAAVTSSILLFKNQLYFTGFSYGIYPFSKFYAGGVRHTEYLAEKLMLEKVAQIETQNAALLYAIYK